VQSVTTINISLLIQLPLELLADKFMRQTRLSNIINYLFMHWTYETTMWQVNTATDLKNMQAPAQILI